MPAGLLASLAGAAYGPMRKVCPVRRLPLQPALRLRLGRDVSGTRMLLPGPSVQRPPVPAASIAPPLPPPAPGTGQDSASVPSASRPPPPCRCSPILSRQHGSRAPFLRPAPALSRFIPIRFPLSGPLQGSASLPALQRQKIVRSTSIFPAIPAPLCKEKSFCEKKREHRPITLFFA